MRQTEGNWLSVRESGTIWGMRFVSVGASILGRRRVHWFLWCLSCYYCVFHRRIRRASQNYLRRIYGHATNRMVLRHIYQFSQCTLDRLYFVMGQLRPFCIERNGSQHLLDLIEAKRGAVLIGAHLGSFEVMRAVAHHAKICINVVAYRGNARRMAQFLDRMSTEQLKFRVVEVDPKDPTVIFEIRDRIEIGEFVAILADRTGIGERSVEVSFLGNEASFPAGPFLIASLLACPVLFVTGLFFPPNRYQIYCEVFADQIVLPRKRRDAALHDYVKQYAERVEYYCRLQPYNWFNFFDFWASKP